MKLTFNSILGKITIYEECNAITGVAFIDDNGIDESGLLLRVKKQIEEYVQGKRQYFDVSLCFSGTDFQKKVWNELMKIPYGKTVSYKELADMTGKPSAYRAVANAVGANPIAIIMPCHRVIGIDGNLHGYRYGTGIKKKLLEIEKRAYTKV